MTANELGCILKAMYENAQTDKIAMVHLFGVKYAKVIRDNKITPKEIIELAQIPRSYDLEINAGINLSKYVDVKPAYR